MSFGNIIGGLACIAAGLYLFFCTDLADQCCFVWALCILLVLGGISCIGRDD